MSDPKYSKQGNVLGRFVEECGEALAAAGKTARFGFDSRNPEIENGETNAEWLHREIVDLEEAIFNLKESMGWLP